MLNINRHLMFNFLSRSFSRQSDSSPLHHRSLFFLNVMMIKMAEDSPASLEVRRMFSRHPHCRHLRSAAGGIKSTELQAADFLRSSSSRPKTTEQLPGTAGNSDGDRGFCYCRDCCCGWEDESLGRWNLTTEIVILWEEGLLRQRNGGDI